LIQIYTKKKFFLYSAPLLLFYTVFVAIPLIICLVYSFTGYRGVGEAVWNNLANYSRLIRDKYVGISIRNSLLCAITMIIVVMPASFAFAYLLNKKTKRNEIYKVVIFAPYVIPGVLAGLIWMFMLEPSGGLINTVLRAIGLDALAFKWIGGQFLSPISFALVCCWCSMGFYMAIWQVSLKSLSADTLEASLIDGCNKRQQIRHIILPMLKDTTVSIFIFVLTSAFKIYEVVYILTGGGPNHASETIVSYMYSTTFESMLYGYGMTIAVMEFFIALCITLLSISLSRKNNNE